MNALIIRLKIGYDPFLVGSTAGVQRSRALRQIETDMAGLGPIDSASGFLDAESAAKNEPDFGFAAAASQDEASDPLGVATSPPYHYVNKAPIDEVPNVDVQFTSKQFRLSIGKYSTDRKGKTVRDPQSPLEPSTGMPTPAARWVARSKTAQAVAKEYFEDNDPSVRGTTFAYRLGKINTPVAMMELVHNNEKGTTEVSLLATHPAVSHAGETMIEKAANESQARGHEGTLYVKSLDKGSDRFYLGVGFEAEGDRMKLTPSTNPLWNNNKGSGWGLTRNDGKKYLAIRPKANDIDDTQ
jgi:hypothetical protein